MVIIKIAMLFNGFDLVTGILGAIRNGEGIQSSKLRDGLFKKVGFICMYIFGIIVSYAQNYITLPYADGLLPIICTYAIGTEIVSIWENIHKINPDISIEKLKKLLGYNGEGK